MSPITNLLTSTKPLSKVLQSLNPDARIHPFLPKQNQYVKKSVSVHDALRIATRPNTQDELVHVVPAAGKTYILDAKGNPLCLVR